MSGTIEQPAAWDVDTFTGKAGDIVALEGGGVSWVDGHQDHGRGRARSWRPGMPQGTFSTSPKDDTYELIINVWNAAEPGPYQFVFQGGKLARE